MPTKFDTKDVIKAFNIWGNSRDSIWGGFTNTPVANHSDLLSASNSEEKMRGIKPQEFEIQAMSEFLKANPDIAKSKLRAQKALSVPKPALILNRSSTLVVRVNSGYARRDMCPPMSCKVDSLYIGKRGDVIFLFKRDNGEIVEMKLREAIQLLDGFWDFVREAFEDVCKEMTTHFKELEIKNEKDRKDKLLNEQRTAAEAKAAKYKGKPFGAW